VNACSHYSTRFPSGYGDRAFAGGAVAAGRAESEGGMLKAEILHSAFFLHTSPWALGPGWTQLESGWCGRRNLRFRSPLNQERSFIPLRLDDIKENN
jgi:hypothetical protein